jgi:hypothetical protein
VGDSDATVHDGPQSASEPPSRPSVTSYASSTVRSPLEALEHDEILRTRWFCFIGLGIGLGGAAGATVLPGDPIATKLFLSAVIVSVFGLAFLYNRTRDPIQFRRASTGLGWFIPAACASTSIPYFGAFSPVAIVLVLGVYFTSLGKSLRLAMTLYGVCAGMQAFVGGLVIAGATDTGIVQANYLTTFEKLIVQALVQMILLATVITARMSRRTTLLALGELESAVRVAAHREALLLEAREELERALRPGRGRFSDQVIGGYTLGALLGRGAMGEVYEAQGSPSSKAQGIVAIKVLAQGSLGNPTHVLRFLRELRTAATIISPYVVRVIEVGEKPVPYLVMERLDGQSLSEILRGRRAFSAEEAIELARHVGKGITAAAQAGIVHRDLKPQNIFRDRDTWKVLDFGVARAIDQGDTLTKGDVVGTPSYMAPEQASGSPATHACDLYALGAILYRAITGQPPYAGGEIAETLYRVVNTRPPRPSDVAPVSSNVDLVLAIGMARAPQDRFTTADEFTAAIEAAFANALSPKLMARARDLERAGAWAPNRRQSTSPTKVPRGSA